MANSNSKIDRKDAVAWVGFDDSAAVLKRIEVPGVAKGLLLRIADGPREDELRQKALDFGFGDLKAKGLMRRIFMDGKIPFSVKEMCEGLGGKPFLLNRKDLMSNDWTVRLAPAAPDAAKNSDKPKPVLPDPDTVNTIGLNMRAEEVVRDGTGRFFRKINKESGVSSYVAESATEQATLFLRAQNAGDLPAIAAGLVNMAGRGTLHESDFVRVLDAALEEGPSGKFDIDPAEARSIVRSDMLRQVSNLGLENDASRDKFTLALRVASNAGAVLDPAPSSDGNFAAGPEFLIFMRRITRSHNSVNFRGSEDLALSLPRSRHDNSSLQVQDLSDMDISDVTAYAMNALTRRPDDGNAVLILKGIPGEDGIERFRTEVGVNYALETVAEIGGTHTAMMIGPRRPEPLEQLPQAAMRTFRIVTPDDYMNLEREINRSRNRIKDFHAGVLQEEIENEDDRVENVRQRPYRPVSKVSEPFTMIPTSLEGATFNAMKEATLRFEERGGVDAVVAESLGLSIEGLGEILNAEQVDAIGLQKSAAEQDRGFLCADQTGIGKGRTLAAIARGHIRSGDDKRVLYFTESANINVPDVCRDLLAVGAFNEGGIAFLTSGSEFNYIEKDPVTGKDVEHTLKSYKPRERKEIMESGVWPEGVKVLITTYSMFNSAEGDPRSDWLLDALDERVMVITDEAHNGLNPKSRTGKNIRAAYAQVERGNSIFGTATPSRDPKGMSLYTSLLPKVEEGRLDTLLTNMAAGGEVAQEAFASMIAEDGAMIRRDHDLSNIEFKVNLPDDETMLGYQSIMNRFSPIVEMMIESSSLISGHTRRRQAVEYQDAIDNGLSPQAARARTNEMNQYSIGLGSPLSNLARITMNAIKIDQVVDAAMNEIREGRKPLITFHSTNAALLN
ncbi:MAG: strawberry notch-like NTP hydrolase domain-containing protein, partial [Roseibium sp.]